MNRMDGLDAFLARHKPIREDAVLAPGDTLGDWRVLAFLGRGGSGEVHEVEHARTGQLAAAKVLTRTDDVSARRFRQECRLLAENDSRAFPRYFHEGESAGHPFMIVELLERRPLPATDAAVAGYLLAICAGVRHLHVRGYVHRDIKPENILFRENGEPVLIDLGLVKQVGGEGPVADDALSIVDGKPVGVGTPKYAAPEQFMGGEVSALADVHALGMLANACFDGNPPWPWRRLIRKATNTIPANRYPSVRAFERAIRRRWIGLVAGLAAVLGIIGVLGTTVWWRGSGHEQAVWRMLQSSLSTNVVEEVVAWERPVTNRFNGQIIVTSERAYRLVTNEVRATRIGLDGRNLRFERPIELDGGEWWIEGPGRLDVSLTGRKGAMIRIQNAIVVNRTTAPLSAEAARYELRGGAGLSFPQLSEDHQSGAILPFDGADNKLLFAEPAWLPPVEMR